MPDDDEKNQSNSDGEDKGNRMDAAKAFFRAMYAGDEPAPQAAASGGSAGGVEDSRRVKELEQQVKEFEQRATDAENLYKRMAADFDNFRRRMDREKEEFTNAGVRKAAEAIIPALDDLDRAMLYLSAETPAEKIIESFQLVANRINQCLEQAGLKRLSTLGEVFDPRFHEPVQQIETTAQPDGTIIHELRGGYLLGDRVIRPALVNVASNNSGTLEFTDVSGASPAPADSDSETSASAVVNNGDAEEAAKPIAASVSSSEPDDKVYDLGDL
jgi:molecular chaperone GrpE